MNLFRGVYILGVCITTHVVGFRLHSSRNIQTRCFESASARPKTLPPAILRATQRVRAITGASLVDCKDAVIISDSDVDAAVALLMSRGKAKANNKQHVLGHGRVGMLAQGRRGVLVEVSCETDFVAKNDRFLSVTANVTKLIWDSTLKPNEIEESKNLRDQNSGLAINDVLKSQSSIFGEAICLRRAVIFDEPSCDETKILEGYVHDAAVRHGVSCGKMGTLLVMETEPIDPITPPDRIEALAHSLALHITSERPSVVDRSNFSPDYLARRRQVVEKDMESSQGIKNFERIVEGKLQKLLKSEILMEQDYALEESKKTIRQVLLDWASRNSAKSVKVKKFCTLAIGD